MDLFSIYDLDSGATLGYYAKGEYSLEEMIKAIDIEEGDRTWPITYVLCCYLRYVPTKEGKSMIVHSSKGRGAFFATVVYKENKDVSIQY